MDDICTELRRVYHLEDVDASHPIRRAVDEIRRLRATLDAAERELSDVRAALGPDSWWMDPPDGGAPTLAAMVAKANEDGRALYDVRRERDEGDEVRMQMADILTRTANALRGPPGLRMAWGWADLPERVAAAIAAIDVMQRAAVASAKPAGEQPQPEAPSGWRMVPVEPTRAMLNAAIDAHGHKLCEISALGIRQSPQWMFEQSYRAMIAAAPQPTEPKP